MSLDPTRLLFCASKKARFCDFIREGSDFSVNILGDHQESLSNFFAHSPDATFAVGRVDGEGQPGFELLNWPDAGKAPRLGDCLASLGCSVHKIHDSGDHWVIVGSVKALHRGKEPAWPLLFFAGGYHRPSRKDGEHLDPAADPYS